MFGSSATVEPNPGAAQASARAEGASGFARAEALSGTQPGLSLRAQSEAALASAREVASGAAFGHSLASAPSSDAFHGTAFLVGDPLAEDAGHALAGNAAAAQWFEDDPRAGWLALGRWEAVSDPGDGVLELSSELGIDLGDAAESGRIALAAFDISVLGSGFQSLTLQIEKNGSLLGETQHYDTAAAVLEAFEDEIFELAGLFEEGDSLLARFDLVLGEGSAASLGWGFAFVVPEPDTRLLLALGLLVLARRRRSPVRA